MKYEVALKLIQHTTTIGLDFNGQGQVISDADVEELRSAIISALSRRIKKDVTPHKVDLDSLTIGRARFMKGTTVYICPRCGSFVSRMMDNCHKCGQALIFPMRQDDMTDRGTQTNEKHN